MKRSILAIFLFCQAFCCLYSFAQDPAVETTAQADNAVRQFELTWSARSRDISLLLQRELKDREDLARVLQVQPDPDCPSEHLSQNDRLLLLGLARIDSELKVTTEGEGKNYDTWDKRYAEVNTPRGSDATKLAIYMQLIFSRARMKMLLILSDLFKVESLYHKTRINNSCAVRRALLAGKLNAEMEAELRKLIAGYDASTERFMSTIHMYHDTLSLILGHWS